MILSCEIRKKGSARSLQSIVGQVEDPETDNKDNNGMRPGGAVIAECKTDISREGNGEDSQDNKGSTQQDEGASSTPRILASIAKMPDQGLHQNARYRTTEPDIARPCVRNPELFHIWSQERELQCPSELHPCCY